MMKNFYKNHKSVCVQWGIVLLLAAVFLLVSALTYKNGLLNEKADMSEDPASDNYYKKRLNSPDISFGDVIGYDLTETVHEVFPKAKVCQVAQESDLVMRTVYGKDDAFMMDSSYFPIYQKSNPTLYMFPETITTNNYGFGMSKTDKGNALLERFNETIRELKKSGQMQILLDKWRNSMKDLSFEEVPLEKVTFADNATELKVSLIYWEPYSFKNSETEEISGFIVDIINRFCQDAEFKPNYEILTSDEGAIMGLESGKYDVYAGGIVRTDERAEQFNITEEIFSEDMKVITRVTRIIGIDVQQYVGSKNFLTYLKNSMVNSLLTNNRWKLLASGLGNTLVISVLSVLFGTLFGMLLYLLSACDNVFLSSFSQLYVTVFQRVPQVLLLLFMYYVVFGGTHVSALLVCILAFTLTFAAFAEEMIRSGVEAIPQGQTLAALSLGFTKSQAFMKIVMPQVIKNVFPVYKGLIVTLVLETSIAGYISVEDLTKMSDIIRSITFEALIPMLVTAIIYFLLTALIGLILTAIEHHMDPGHRRRLPKWVENCAKS